MILQYINARQYFSLSQLLTERITETRRPRFAMLRIVMSAAQDSDYVTIFHPDLEFQITNSSSRGGIGHLMEKYITALAG